MRFLRRSLTGLLLLSVTLAILAFAADTIRSAVSERMGAEQRVRPARERVFAVNVVPFTPGTVTPVLETFGEVRSRRTLEMRAAARGTIARLHDAFEEGGRVEAGDLLLRIDQQDALAALEIARTDLAEAQAEEREAKAALELAREDVAAAREQLELREKVLNRARQLFERRVGTEDAVENAELAASSARQAVLAKRQALAQAEARADQAVTSVARREIALAEAERRLAETEVYARFSGTLANVSVVEGGLVQANERVADLVDPDALEVAFRVSNSEYSRLLDEDGRLIPARVDVALDLLGTDLTASGTISRESAVVEEGQTGRQLFARLETAPGFRPGDFVTLRVHEPPLRFVAELPAAAVDSAGTVLVLAEGDRLEVAPVRLMRRQGDTVLVRSRDLVGREVVAERTPLLGAGIKVRPLRPGEAAEVPQEQAMVELTEERRARLVAFVEANQRMPAEAKKRVLAQLSQPKVPAQIVERIESRMGG